MPWRNAPCLGWIRAACEVSYTMIYEPWRLWQLLKADEALFFEAVYMWLCAMHVVPRHYNWRWNLPSEVVLRECDISIYEYRCRCNYISCLMMSVLPSPRSSYSTAPRQRHKARAGSMTNFKWGVATSDILWLTYICTPPGWYTPSERV